jgi:hypothetical protein
MDDVLRGGRIRMGPRNGKDPPGIARTGALPLRYGLPACIGNWVMRGPDHVR